MRDIYVYGTIGEGFDDADMPASKFVTALRDAGGEDVTVHINSCGGDVFDANAMAEALRGYKGRTTASIEGLAASSASFFALTADEVIINPSALVMIHNPYTWAAGNAEDMRRAADMLDKVRSTISGQYARKTGRDASEIESLMDAETWFTAEQAVEFGFADRMTDALPVAACIGGADLARFKNAPKDLAESVAGDAGGTIHAAADKQPEQGACEGGAGAVAKRTVCVNGQFLTY